jgi:glutamate synthase (NADPH/NADH) large chain
MAKIRVTSSSYTGNKFRRSNSTSAIRSPGAAKASKRAGIAGREAEDAVRSGFNILIVSDRKVDATASPFRRCWRLRAVHQHLVAQGLRTSTGLVVETGSAREVHHFALLAGYGAEAIHPYLAMETWPTCTATSRRSGRPRRRSRTTSRRSARA